MLVKNLLTLLLAGLAVVTATNSSSSSSDAAASSSSSDTTAASSSSSDTAAAGSSSSATNSTNNVGGSSSSATNNAGGSSSSATNNVGGGTSSSATNNVGGGTSSSATNNNVGGGTSSSATNNNVGGGATSSATNNNVGGGATSSATGGDAPACGASNVTTCAPADGAVAAYKAIAREAKLDLKLDLGNDTSDLSSDNPTMKPVLDATCVGIKNAANTGSSISYVCNQFVAKRRLSASQRRLAATMYTVEFTIIAAGPGVTEADLNTATGKVDSAVTTINAKIALAFTAASLSAVSVDTSYTVVAPTYEPIQTHTYIISGSWTYGLFSENTCTTAVASTAMSGALNECGTDGVNGMWVQQCMAGVGAVTSTSQPAAQTCAAGGTNTNWVTSDLKVGQCVASGSNWYKFTCSATVAAASSAMERGVAGLLIGIIMSFVAMV